MMWRETGRTAKVAGFDSRVMLSFVLFAVHMSMWTLYLVFATLIFFTILSQFGYTLPNALRRMRVLVLFGKTRPAIPFWRRQQWR